MTFPEMAPLWVALSSVLGTAGLAVPLTRWWVRREIVADSIRMQEDLGGFQVALNEHSIVSMADARGSIIYVNDKFCDISRYERSELLGKDHRIVNSRHHPPELFRDMWKTIRSGQTWHGELCNRAKDGTLYWVDTVIVPVRDASGTVDRFVSIRYDITQRKRTTEILTQAISSMRDGFVVFDSEDRLVICNDAYKNLYHTFRQEFKTGAKFEDLLRLGLECGKYPDAASFPGGEEAWVAERLHSHRSCGDPFVFQLSDGRWIQSHESRTVGGYIVGFRVDISALKQIEQARAAHHQKLQGLFDHSPVGIVLTDLKTGYVLDCNGAMESLVGRKLAELVGRKFVDIVAVESVGAFLAEHEILQRTGRYGSREIMFRGPPSVDRCAALLSGQRIEDADGREIVWWVVLDISGRKAIELELTRAAENDRLTGLANRSTLTNRLQARVLLAHRQENHQRFAVLFLDFDRFKTINDSLGHAAGDALLCEIATRLRKRLRNCDTGESRDLIARFGGDEFVILLGDVVTAEEARAVADRLLTTLGEPYVVSGHEIQSSASIGIVMGDANSLSADALLRDADTAMYEAKRLGRGRAVIFDASMQERAARRLTLQNHLRKALGTAQLSLVYQPIVELETGATVSAEALLRWTDPVLGPISPNEFIPVAEESGLIVSIGDWVLERACRDFMEWKRVSPMSAPRSISVNVSRVQMNFAEQLLATLSRVIHETGIEPQALQIEITEREAMRDVDAFLALTQRIKALGVKLAMDDFGTGTSSLGALRELPFDAIKIDRSFVHGIETNRDVVALLHSAVTLVGNLGMRSVAEGVETTTQAAILASLGCQYAQGYLFSRPVDADRLLSSNSLLQREATPRVEAEAIF